MPKWGLTKQICIRTTEKLHRRVMNILNKKNKSLSSWFREICESYVKQHEKKEKEDYSLLHKMCPLTGEDLLVLDLFKVGVWYGLQEYYDMKLNADEDKIFNALMVNGYFIKSGASLEFQRTI